MNKAILRMISGMALFSLILILNSIPEINHRTVMSIAIIMIFLIIFTYIFETKGPNLMKLLMIIFSFIILPLFTLAYLEIPDCLPTPWGGLTTYIIALSIGLISIYTIFKLSYVEIEYMGR